MNAYQSYSIESELGGWTRIDMLLALYDRAIDAVTGAQIAYQQGDDERLARASLEAHRFLLALHGGLKTDEFTLATDIARLLNFIMLRMEEKNFDESIHFLEKLRTAYAQIQDEANQLERCGKIPPLDSRTGLNTVA